MDQQRPPMIVVNIPPVPPSNLLPPIRKALELPCPDIARLVGELARIYTPDVLGTQFEVTTPARQGIFRRKKKGRKGPHRTLNLLVVDSGYASLVVSDDESDNANDNAQSTAITKAVQTLAQDLSNSNSNPDNSDEISEQLSLLRSDEFERSYAMKWLTGLIAHSEEWTELGIENEDSDLRDSNSPNESINREHVIEKASALLAACSGASASGALTRSFTYHPRISHSVYGSSVGNLTPTPIQIRLKDDSLPAQDHTAVGLQTWGSASILAQLISENPRKYGLDFTCGESRVYGPGVGVGRQTSTSFSVLELGAGTGLLSLFTWRLLEQQLDRHHSLSSSVVATDFHPSVLSNLNFNLNLNPPSQTTLSSPSRSPTSIDAKFLDWNSCVSLPDDERFNIVFGADVVYEKGHAQLIKSVVEKTLKRPVLRFEEAEGVNFSARYNGGGAFWLIYPLRPTHGVETESIEKSFGEVVDSSKWAQNVVIANGNRAGSQDWSLGVLEMQSLERRKGIGRADEVSYRILKVGWVIV